jgi:hypothetical protein
MAEIVFDKSPLALRVLENQGVFVFKCVTVQLLKSAELQYGELPKKTLINRL